MIDSVSRFSDRVANYVKYRPDYPREVIAYLTKTAELTPDSVIADIGAGTGISSRMFLENGNRLFGVEPNEKMREAAVEYLADLPGFTSIDGTSDATTLADDSVDMIVAAQAFHWFEPEVARAEFLRILKPGGHIVLIWNERCLERDEFHVGYESLLKKYANDYGSVRHENIAETELSGFFQQPYSTAEFVNTQEFDLAGITGRMLSSSYMPNEDSPRYAPLIHELKTLFAKYAENGRIIIFYDTRVYVSKF